MGYEVKITSWANRDYRQQRIFHQSYTREGKTRLTKTRAMKTRTWLKALRYAPVQRD
jgi:hypothetical protein